MNKRIIKLLNSGAWMYPLFLMGVIYYEKKYLGVSMSLPEYIYSALLAFVTTALLTMNKRPEIKEDDETTGRKKAMYPPVDDAMLFTTPTGVVLGKYKSKYVCRDISQDGHVCILGGSGSGKTSTVFADTILANADGKATLLAIDIKGELHEKFVRRGDKKCLIFDPQDRITFGYNPLFRLNCESSAQDIFETMQSIAYSLLPLPPGTKDPFWIRSARNLLLGLLIYFYKDGVKDYVGLIDSILSSPVSDTIKNVMDDSGHGSTEYRLLTQFVDMAEETLGSIVAEMNNHIGVFVNDQDIRFAFRENRKKITPEMLEEGYSIYLSIREDKLSAYYDVLQLIINQTLELLEKRPENSSPIILMLDELPRILSAGKIERLLDAARTLRSRKVTLIMVAQSVEGLMIAYTDNEKT